MQGLRPLFERFRRVWSENSTDQRFVALEQALAELRTLLEDRERTSAAAIENRLARFTMTAERMIAESMETQECIASEAMAACRQLAEQSVQPPAADEPPLDGDGVFVVGSARSGTSILGDCINVSPEVFLLHEPDLFLNHGRADFVEFFNGRHRSFGNLVRKGCFAPGAKGPERNAFALLRRMRQWHRYVGEKVAIGPRPNALGDDWQRKCFEFYATHFYGSHFFLILRTPGEVVLSMRKMWPFCTLPHLLECWILATSFILDLYLAFGKSYVIFFDRFAPQTVGHIADLLQIPIDVPDGMIGEQYQRSTLPPKALPDFLGPYTEAAHECRFIYKHLRDNFGCDSLRYEGTENLSSFCNGIKVRLQKVLVTLEPELGQLPQAA